MNLENLGNIRIFSPDWQAWGNGAELENDLLTFENSRLDSFTSFLNFTVVDIYHNLVGRHIHVSTIGLLPISRYNRIFHWPKAKTQTLPMRGG